MNWAPPAHLKNDLKSFSRGTYGVPGAADGTASLAMKMELESYYPWVPGAADRTADIHSHSLGALTGPGVPDAADGIADMHSHRFLASAVAGTVDTAAGTVHRLHTAEVDQPYCVRKGRCPAHHGRGYRSSYGDEAAQNLGTFPAVDTFPVVDTVPDLDTFPHRDLWGTDWAPGDLHSNQGHWHYSQWAFLRIWPGLETGAGAT